MSAKPVQEAAEARRIEAIELVRQIQERYGIEHGNRGRGSLNLRSLTGVGRETVSHWRSGAHAPQPKTIALLRRRAASPPQSLFALLFDMYLDEHGTAQEALHGG